MIAKSGEVFFTVSGNLQMVSSMDEYQTMIDKKVKLETTYFELSVNGEHVKLLATRTQAIMNLIMQLPTTRITQEIIRYQTVLKEIDYARQ